jgi:hypothetical protein
MAWSSRGNLSELIWFTSAPFSNSLRILLYSLSSIAVCNRYVSLSLHFISSLKKQNNTRIAKNSTARLLPTVAIAILDLDLKKEIAPSSNPIKLAMVIEGSPKNTKIYNTSIRELKNSPLSLLMAQKKRKPKDTSKENIIKDSEALSVRLIFLTFFNRILREK